MASKIKQQIKNVVARHGLSAGEHPMFLPGRDWQVMLIGVVVINIVIAGLASYMFLQIKDQSFFTKDTAQSQAQPPRIQKNELSNTVEYYEQKRSQFESFQNSAPAIVDPS